MRKREIKPNVKQLMEKLSYSEIEIKKLEAKIADLESNPPPCQECSEKSIAIKQMGKEMSKLQNEIEVLQQENKKMLKKPSDPAQNQKMLATTNRPQIKIEPSEDM